MKWSDVVYGFQVVAGCAADVGQWFGGLFTPEHSEAWVSGFTGAFGAVFGSIVTIIWTEWFNKRSFDRHQKERNSAALFGCLHRLNQIYSGSTKIRDHLNEQLPPARAAKAAGEVPYASLHVIPMLRMSGPVEFPVEELWLAARAGGDSLINAITALDARYNNLNDTVQMYHDKRVAVLSLLPNPTALDEQGAAETGLTEAEMARVQPGLYELDSLLEQMQPLAVELVSDAFAALRELVHAEKSPFRVDFKLALPDPEGREVVLTSSESPHRSLKGKAKKSKTDAHGAGPP
jgi:hypothetical protein